jgi:hypothetical protein
LQSSRLPQVIHTTKMSHRSVFVDIPTKAIQVVVKLS